MSDSTGDVAKSARSTPAAPFSATKTDSFEQDGFTFSCRWDHILPSGCTHKSEPEADCTVCYFSHGLATLPHLPDMIFPKNELTVGWTAFSTAAVTFNAFDALKMVDVGKLPDVQVAASAAWQEARRDLPLTETSRPFDWTFTSPYAGTLQNVSAEEAPTERIDMEMLRRQEPIHFYTQCSLYEDELADNGAAQMSVRLRVMPGYWFVLQRFYLRVDHVLVRVCDTRLFGCAGEDASILREWTRREAKIDELSSRGLENEQILDPNVVWQHLPIVEHRVHRLRPTR